MNNVTKELIEAVEGMIDADESIFDMIEEVLKEKSQDRTKIIKIKAIMKGRNEE